MVVIDIVVPEIDFFASSTGKFNIINLDHMKKLGVEQMSVSLPLFVL